MGLTLPPVAFRLRMLQRVAVDFRRGSLKYGRVVRLGQFQHVQRAEHTSFGRLDGVHALIRGRTGRTGQIVNFVNGFFDTQRLGNILMNKAKLRPRGQFADIFHPSRGIIIHAKNPMSLRNQTPAKVRPQKSRSTRNQYCCHNQSPSKTFKSTSGKTFFFVKPCSSVLFLCQTGV